MKTEEKTALQIDPRDPNGCKCISIPYAIRKRDGWLYCGHCKKPVR